METVSSGFGSRARTVKLTSWPTSADSSAVPLPIWLKSMSENGESREPTPSAVCWMKTGGPLKRITWHWPAELLRPRPHLMAWSSVAVKHTVLSLVNST